MNAFKRGFRTYIMFSHPNMRVRPLIPATPVKLRPVRVMRPVLVRANWADTLVQNSRILGDGLIWFVFLASSMNYLYYRNLRKDYEDRNKTDNERDRK